VPSYSTREHHNPKSWRSLPFATLQESWRTMVQIAQCLDFRVSESAALQWDDFDFDKISFSFSAVCERQGG
jgi:hypothetical protein